MQTTTNPAACWYAINAQQGQDTAEVKIYDVIGAFGVTADAFVSELGATKAKTISVRINTPGGDMFQATAIYNALLAHPARVITQVDGLAASAGSVIAMAGDEVRMADNAYLMMHNARSGVMGDVNDMRSVASMLEKVNANIAGAYERKSGKPIAQWLEAMNAETWFTAEEAKAAGLADTVFAASKPQAKYRISAQFDFAVYNKIPEQVRESWGLQTASASIDPPTPITNAPEGSSNVAEPSPASQQEITPMSESSQIQAAPAQNPAPATNGIPQGNPAPVTMSHEQEREHLKTLSAEARYQHGLKQGRDEGANSAVARLKAIAAVCSGKPQMALDSFLANQTPDAVRIAYDAVIAGERQLEAVKAEMQIENERLRTLIDIGGHTGVNAGLGGEIEYEHVDPQAQAEMEWEQRPGVRKGFSGKASYVAFRKLELAGRA